MDDLRIAVVGIGATGAVLAAALLKRVLSASVHERGC